jgi:hypothetical protein
MDRGLDEAEALLLKWADSMRSESLPVDGWAEKAQGGFIGSWIKDFEELCDTADSYQIDKIQAAIDSLHITHNRVIYQWHGIICPLVWRFGNEEALYQAAKEAFRIRYFGA